MLMFGIVKRGILEIMFAQNWAYQDQRGAGEFGFADFFRNGGERAVDELLVGPADAEADDDGAIRAIIRREFAFDMREIADGKMDGEGCSGLGEIGEAFAFWHGR